MHCEMLGKKCARTFCMAFSHKRVRDKDGCKEMKGYCRHYRKFWKVESVHEIAAQESVAQEPVESVQIKHAPNGCLVGHRAEMRTDLSSGAQNKIHD